VGRESVRVRRPEQGTGPNVYYIGADESAIDPEALPAADLYMFMRPARLTATGTVRLIEPAPAPQGLPASATVPARRVAPAGGNGGVPVWRPAAVAMSAALPGDGVASGLAGLGLRVSAEEAHALDLRAQGVRDTRTYRASAQIGYDIPKARPWGWMVSAYLGTKSIAAGAFLLTWLTLGLGLSANRTLFGIAAPITAIVLLGITLLFLVLDLKRPERFWFVLLKPNPTSWLVWGAWILQGYGALLVLWLGGEVFGWVEPLRVLVWPTAVLAAGAAGYTAMLFGQSEGRDFWQSPLLLPHLLVQAVLAGASVLALVSLVVGGNAATGGLLVRILIAAVVAHALLIGSELFVPHTNHHVAAAGHLLIAGALARPFWGLAVGVGIALTLVMALLAALTAAPAWLGIGAVAALVGVFAYEHVYVVAGQSVPLS
jgi:formate-dependent nitrite reductase membrane component NrfD